MVHAYFELFVSIREKEHIYDDMPLFCLADQVFGDEEMHATVRENCMDYIVSDFLVVLHRLIGFLKVKNADFFRAYITEDFDHYITRKRRQNCHGNHIEMIALSELYNRPIEVYEYSTGKIFFEINLFINSIDDLLKNPLILFMECLKPTMNRFV